MFILANRLLVRSLLSALIGHLTAFLLLIPITAVALTLEDPAKVSLPAAFVALGLGAAAAGIAARRMRLGFLGGVLGGLVFALIPFTVSFFFDSSEFFTLGTRFLVFFAALVIASVFAAFSPKKKKTLSLAQRKKRLYGRTR